MTTKVTMPQLGESVVEGTVGKWLVSEGEAVEKDQPIVEILTDKADSELPAPVAGVVTKLLAEVDDVLEVGAPLCEIDENGTASAAKSEPKADAPKADAPKADAPKSAPSDDPAASPSVRKLARELGVDLASVSGSGESGRITHEDVQQAASAPAPKSPPASAPPRPAPAPRASAASGAGVQVPSGAFRVPPYRPSEGDEVVPFSRRRRIIADHMVYSKHVSPEVVTFAECDLYETAKLRDAHKGRYKKEGLSLTYLAFVVAATARALREYPELNSRVLDDAYVKLGDVNLGIAVDTPKGLVVPVIRNADELTVRGLARAIIDIAERSRDGNLTPDDLSGKTFSISNPGRKGNLVGGAIISQPNTGILRIGTIKKRPVVVEKDGQDLIAIHPVMYMALTYDHRVVDGVNANGFLYRVSEILEQGDFEV
ncbi:MAG: 2-oxo acid dehydrogenase subunit E2 [Deltaproteobacteria bacterium]|nr:2-oxo acid dehydrogenase subunit E2 [Deltaproteobacteria bacterium]